jgi:hypothetical protein
MRPSDELSGKIKRHCPVDPLNVSSDAIFDSIDDWHHNHTSFDLANPEEPMPPRS